MRNNQRCIKVNLQKMTLAIRYDQKHYRLSLKARYEEQFQDTPTKNSCQ